MRKFRRTTQAAAPGNPTAEAVAQCTELTNAQKCSETFDDIIYERNAKTKKKNVGGWQPFGLDRNVLRGVEKSGYRVPTPIQRKAVPLLLSGKDVLAMARTGSGKTAAFLLPLFQKLKYHDAKAGFRALLVSPTRELALQTFKFCKDLGKFTGIRAAVVVGGDSLDRQFGSIHENPDIVIATPGRLLHVVVEMNLRLTQVQYVVFDEADRLFEMGMADQLNEVLLRLPESRQTALFSATLPKMLVDFAKAGLKDPEMVRLDVDSKISEKLTRYFFACRNDDRMAVYLSILRNIINTKTEQTIVFCATKHFVDYVRMVTEESNFACTYIYSDLDIVARQQHMSRFRHGQCNILIVTDVAARGVDIPLLDNVINFHFPPKPKLFVHRVGRVARAGRSGRAFSLVGPDELPYLVDLSLFLSHPLKCVRENEADQTDGEPVTLLGAVPQVLIDNEQELLQPMMCDNSNVQETVKVARNSMKQFIRSRPVASSESTKRVKNEFRSLIDHLGSHPLLANQAKNGSMAPSGVDLINRLKNYKPHVTVFESQSSNRVPTCAVMKSKRRAHGKYVKTNASAKAKEVTLTSIDPDTKLIPQVVAVKKSKLPRRDDAFFVAYAPKDYHSEQGLSVGHKVSSFEHQAKQAVVDFTADDGQEMYKQKSNMKKWDRKRKRFVGDSGNEGKKKRVKTEDGRWVASGLKTGRYEKWLKHQRIAREMAENEDGTNQTASTPHRQRTRIQKRTKKGKGPRNELKSNGQILKQRQRKEKHMAFQKSRQKMRAKRHARMRGR